MYKKIAFEAGKEDLPILYNVNFGHTSPMAILPLGLKVEVDLDKKKNKIFRKANGRLIEIKYWN